MSRIAPWLADSRWPTVPIRYVAKLGTGHTPSRQKPEYWKDCDVPWVTLADVWQLRDGTLDYVHDTKEKISEIGLANSSAVIHPAGTVILSRTASVGFSAIMGKDMATSQDFATWTCGHQLDSKYLLYVLRAMAPDLRRVAAGSTHKTIYMPDIEELRTPLPSLDEQRRIAGFLDAEMSRIEVIARVRARQIDLLAERRESAAREALAEVLGDVVELRRAGVTVTTGPFGTVFAATDYVSGGVPMINPTHIKNNRLEPDSHHAVSNSTAIRLGRHRLRAGDLVVGRKGDIGRAALVEPYQDGWICGSDCISLHAAGSKLEPRFLAHLLSLSEMRSQLLERSAAATMPSLSEGNLLQLRVPMPSRQSQMAIVARLDEMVAWTNRSSDAMRRQVSLVDEHRHALVAAAVTGAIDVTSAEGMGT
ncbi:restriction endonuclease subunit S [Micromonospora sp. CA-248089]|uniref:restriction endonuclease subunit S n=1 Tax=Micromonospora sp. CA-248089 TaxID=3239960 RepID=UPI003D934ED9